MSTEILGEFRYGRNVFSKVALVLENLTSTDSTCIKLFQGGAEGGFCNPGPGSAPTPLLMKDGPPQAWGGGFLRTVRRRKLRPFVALRNILFERIAGIICLGNLTVSVIST